MTTFGRVVPSIYVRDLDVALHFYRDLLGFTVKFNNGEPAAFAVIEHGDAQLHLAVRAERAGSCHAHIMTNDVDALHGHLCRANVQIRQPPMIQPWDLKDIVVADPDGNTFEFAQTVGEAVTV